MATLFHLVRHAAHDTVDNVLVGRAEGVGLSPEGVVQARRLAAFVARLGPTVVQSSPRERALQTAEPIARAAGLPLEVALQLDEIDFGSWTGRSFSELAADPAWHEWNARRATARTPAGATMREAQNRAVLHLRAIGRERGGPAVIVTHAEIIRAIVLHCLEAGLDEFDRIAVPPASVTTVEIGSDGARVVRMNGAAAA